MSHTRRRRGRGFMFIEMMIAISILIVFAVVAVRLTHLCLTVPQKAAEAQSAFERFDIAVERLRQDVWAAGALRCPDDKTLEIGAGKDPAVVWRVEADGTLSRTARQPDDAQQTPSVRRWEARQQIRFAAQGATCTLAVTQDAETARTEMISQRLLDGGVK